MSNYFHIPPCMTKLWVGHEQVSLKPIDKVTECTVTLAFNLGTWFLFATYRLVIMITCARLFSNPTMYDKVIGRTRTGFIEAYAQSLSKDCDLDL